MLRPGTTIAGRVLERKSGAGRPPGPRADLLSDLHSATGALQQNNYCMNETIISANLSAIAAAFIRPELFIRAAFIDVRSNAIA